MLGRLFDLLSKMEDDLERKVSISKNLCLNVRSGRTLCRACEDVCPTGALNFEDLSIASEKCLACGLCAVACPTGVLDELWTAARKTAEIIKHPASELWVVCQKAGSMPDALRINCLGELTSELILLLLVRGVKRISVLYDPQQCRECNLCTGQENWIKLQNQLKAIYPPEDQRIQIHEQVADKQTNRRPVDLSRRRMLRSFSDEARQMAAHMLPGTSFSLDHQKFEQGLSLRRKILITVLNQLNDEQKVLLEPGYLRHPEVTGDCILCGSCATLCPSGAMRLEALDNDMISLTVSPSVCNMCGLCAAVCPIKAVRVEGDAATEGPPQRQVLIQGEQRGCEKCHQGFWAALGRDASLCPECSHRNSKPRMTWPELVV